MRNIETFPSKQMYPYLSLVERKVAEFYLNIDTKRWLVWLKWLIFITFSGQLMVSLSSAISIQYGGVLIKHCLIMWLNFKLNLINEKIPFITFAHSLTPNRKLGWLQAPLGSASPSQGQSHVLGRGGWSSSCPPQARAGTQCKFATAPWIW